MTEEEPLITQKMLEVRGNTIRVVQGLAHDKKSYEMLIEGMGPITKMDISWVLQNIVTEIYREEKPPKVPWSEEMN